MHVRRHVGDPRDNVDSPRSTSSRRRTAGSASPWRTSTLTWDMHGVIFPHELRERRDRLSGHARSSPTSRRCASPAGATWPRRSASARHDLDPASHESIPLDARAVLQRAVEQVQNSRVSSRSAAELEFHLCSQHPFYQASCATSIREEPGSARRQHQAHRDSGSGGHQTSSPGKPRSEVEPGHSTIISITGDVLMVSVINRQQSPTLVKGWPRPCSLRQQ